MAGKLIPFRHKCEFVDDECWCGRAKGALLQELRQLSGLYEGDDKLKEEPTRPTES